MRDIISSLFQTIRTAFISLMQFFAILVLGIIAAILIVLPWLLRAVSMLLWLIAGYLSITGIELFYSQYISSPIPIYALQFSVILLMVAWTMIGMMQKGKHAIWGFLAAGGLSVGLFVLFVVPWLFKHWPTSTDLIFRVLPSSILVMTLVFMTIRLKRMHSANGIKLYGPAFIWLGRFNHFSKGGDAIK